MATQNLSYIMAETAEERVAIGVINFLEVWYASNGIPEPPMPGVEYLKLALKPHMIKEVLTKVHGELSLREQSMQERQHMAANGIMIANAEIQKSLKPEHL